MTATDKTVAEVGKFVDEYTRFLPHHLRPKFIDGIQSIITIAVAEATEHICGVESKESLVGASPAKEKN